MTERLIIDGTAVYEIDEDCLRRREAEEQQREQEREKEKRTEEPAS